MKDSILLPIEFTNFTMLFDLCMNGLDTIIDRDIHFNKSHIAENCCQKRNLKTYAYRLTLVFGHAKD